MTPVVVRPQGANILIRALYFIFFGLWFSGVWAAVAWVLCVTVIGLPLGLWMLNRLPQVSTLQPEGRDVFITQGGQVFERAAAQPPFLLRALYFVLVGWWFSAIWISVAWALCAVVVGLPFGFWMLNRVPAVVTLANR